MNLTDSATTWRSSLRERGNVLIVAVLVLGLIWGLIYYRSLHQKDRKKIEELEKEFSVLKDAFKPYQELVKAIQLRQHDFMNHLSALMGLHMVCNSHEEWEKLQKEYGQILIENHKYSKLLKIGTNALTGFLYQKLSGLEEAGIPVELEVHASELPKDCILHGMVEVLGVLLDNAAEARQEDGKKNRIALLISEKENEYLFAVQNRSVEVKYSEMTTWFRLHKSSKGSGRGMGLHQAKKVCHEHGWRIQGRKLVKNEENWIEFTLAVLCRRK